MSAERQGDLLFLKELVEAGRMTPRRQHETGGALTKDAAGGEAVGTV